MDFRNVRKEMMKSLFQKWFLKTLGYFFGIKNIQITLNQFVISPQKGVDVLISVVYPILIIIENFWLSHNNSLYFNYLM